MGHVDELADGLKVPLPSTKEVRSRHICKEAAQAPAVTPAPIALILSRAETWPSEGPKLLCFLLHALQVLSTAAAKARTTDCEKPGFEILNVLSATSC